jgi:hypothetical protein
VTKAAFARAVAACLGLNEEAMRADLGIRRPALAPLEPDAFMRWAWTRGKGTSPQTLGDLAFSLGVDPRAIRRDWIRLSARVRRNQRLNLDPWLGLR